MDYLNAFLCGGILCAIGQVLIDKTQRSRPGTRRGQRGGRGAAQRPGPLPAPADWGGAGATVPLTGFGHALAKGVEKAVAEQGWLGVLTGGFTAASGGIAAAVVAAVVAALLFRPGDKR